MDWEELAPWVAIAITLALSILVPLFTQIANNNHHRKMQKEKIDFEQSQKKREVYEEFLANVGNAITAKTNLGPAGSSLYKMYIYAPPELHNHLDQIADNVSHFHWDIASDILQDLSRLLKDDLESK